MAVGIFGGTFDPVHIGHLRVAEEVREACGLEKVLFMPVSSPPHKKGRSTTEPETRLKLLGLAVEGVQHFVVSDMEIARGGMSYSIDTVTALEASYPELCFIIGMDAFREIDTWHRYPDLFFHTNFLVMTRSSGMPPRAMELLPPDVRAVTRARDDGTLEHASGREIRFLHVTRLDISSTKIRELARLGRSIRYLVPGAVERYILDRGLYGN
jgi:nicotinate-nucleotide adenylyltransferase